MSLIDLLIAYKLAHYNKIDYDHNNILINYESIKQNYKFIKFVYITWIHPEIHNKKKFKKKLNELSILVEVNSKDILEYIITSN